MNKSWFQIILSLYVFCSFITGVYFFYHIISKPFFSLLTSGNAFDVRLVALGLIYTFISFLILCLLLAALQIFRSGSWKILKYLLYASIPTFNVFGVMYQFYFMPYLYAVAGFNTVGPQFLGNVDFGFYPLTFGINVSLLSENNTLFLAGLNIVPIIAIVLLKKYYRQS